MLGLLISSGSNYFVSRFSTEFRTGLYNKVKVSVAT